MCKVLMFFNSFEMIIETLIRITFNRLKDRMLANSVMKSIISNITNNDKQKMKQISSINYEINRNNALCAKRVTKTFSDFCFNIVEVKHH